MKFWKSETRFYEIGVNENPVLKWELQKQYLQLPLGYNRNAPQTHLNNRDETDFEPVLADPYEKLEVLSRVKRPACPPGSLMHTDETCGSFHCPCGKPNPCDLCYCPPCSSVSPVNRTTVCL